MSWLENPVAGCHRVDHCRPHRRAATAKRKPAPEPGNAIQPLKTSIVVTATRSETEPEKSPVSAGVAQPASNMN
jgi:hypothetical protein